MTGIVMALLCVSFVLVGVATYSWARAAEIRRAAVEASEVHRLYVEQLRADHQREVIRLQNALQFGIAQVTPALHLEPPPDGETRLAKRIDESVVEAQNSAIDKGAERLTAEYAAAGFSFSPDEIREHAAALLRGEPIPGVEYFERVPT